MNILVSTDKNYLRPLSVMLASLAASDPSESFEIYIMNRSLSAEDFSYLGDALTGARIALHDIKVDDGVFAQAPVSDRYPPEMYFRILAARFLPRGLERVLYLDPDIIVLRPLSALYGIPLDGDYYAAASHVGEPLRRINEIRLHMDIPGQYINSGVMLMNLSALRAEQDEKAVFEFIENNRSVLMLPDQDIINSLYSQKIRLIDPMVYNMTEKLLTFRRTAGERTDSEWVCRNTAVIHYCGRMKPWKTPYIGRLDVFYHIFASLLDEKRLFR